jgi:hypothetical protein
LRQNIINTKNNYIYSLPYQPNTNPIEGLFSQIKNYVRQDNPQTFNDLYKSIQSTIKTYIKKIHLENYFNTLFLQANSFIETNIK